jgi:hypothetical protein
MNKRVKKELLADATPVEDESIAPATRIVISKPKIKKAVFKLIGETPYVSNNFNQEAQDEMAEKQKKGSQNNKDMKRTPKDFDKQYRGSLHISTEGWYGHPASTFRTAMIDACRTVGYKMTHAKMALFVLADGYDADDGRPLVRIEGKPEQFRSYVRLADNSPDIKARGRWETWSINLRIEYDADMFSHEDVANLLMRVGRQVGIGAGRPFSKTRAARTGAGSDWTATRMTDMSLTPAMLAELQELARLNKLTTKAVLKKARDPKSALHNHPDFDGWDIEKAALKHWMAAARGIIRVYVTLIDDDGEDKEMRAVVHMRDDDGQPIYQPTQRVIRENRERLINIVCDKILSAIRWYSLKEFDPVVELVEQIRTEAKPRPRGRPRGKGGGRPEARI